MKILLAHEFYRSSAPSGEDAVYINERNMLTNNGLEVISHEIHNDDIDDTTLSNRIKLGLDTIWSRDSYKAIMALLNKHKPDIAHFHNTFPLLSPSVYSACKQQGTPVIQTIHNYRMICPGALLQRNLQPCEDCLHGSLVSSLVHRCYRNSLAATAPLAGMIAINRLIGSYSTHIDRYISLTKFASSRLVSGKIPKERITVKPNFLPNPPPPGEGQGGYAVYVGRLSAEKGLRTLLNAATLIPHIPIKILGDGPLRDELESKSRNLNINIEFYGSVDKNTVLATIRNAAFQIIPSEWYEGFPMVALEAYASGTPILASKIGSLDEIVQEGVTGLKFESGNANDLAEKAVLLMEKSKSSEKMRLNSRDFFDKQFTEELNFRSLLDIYQDVIKQYKYE